MNILSGLMTGILLLLLVIAGVKASASEAMTPQLNVYEFEDLIVEELVSQGQIQNITIQPNDRAAYRLVNPDGSSNMDSGELNNNPDIKIPEWRLYEW